MEINLRDYTDDEQLIDSINKAYGVIFPGSSQTGVRTGLAKGKIAQSGVGTQQVLNDFDFIAPWKDMKRVNLTTNNGVQTMVEIPLFYICTDIQDAYFVSMEKLYGFRPAQSFYREDGSLAPFYYIGAYETSGASTTLRSAPGLAPCNNSRATFRTWAKLIIPNPGSTWKITDIAEKCDIMDSLIMIEFATRNTRNIALGNINSGRLNTGQTDSVIASSGSLTSLINGNESFKWRGIENPWGNVNKHIDGINVYNYIPFVCSNPEYYADDTTAYYGPLRYSISQRNGTPVIALGNDDAYFPWCRLPYDTGEDHGGSLSTYYCSNFNTTSGWRPVSFGGAYNSGLVTGNSGLFYYRAADATTVASTDFGSRLSYMELKKV